MPIQTFTSVTDLSRCTYDHHVELVEGQARLKPHIRLADDIGSVTRNTFELVQGGVWAKKTFLLGFTDVRDAEAVLRIVPQRTDAHDDPAILYLDVNGHTIEHQFQQKNTSFQGELDEYWSSGWEIIRIPAKALKAGLNDFVIRDGSGKGWRLFVDTMRCQGRSAKSIDDGHTWVTERLGLNDFIVGEYVVRLNLRRHAPCGLVTSPVVDLASSAAESPITPRMVVKSVCLKPSGTTPRGTGITFQWRAGSTPSYRPETWSPWQDTTGAFCVPKSHRFVQWRATLTTAHGGVTPVLHDLVIEVSGDVTKRANEALAVVSAHNDPLIHCSYPFACQLADEPRLQTLRTRWRLDHVVANAGTEFEKFLRLKRWVRHQWEDGWNTGTLSFVPPWDALVVLELAGQQLSLGMCTHYASTFVQCCLALGFQARVCITTAHCVAEIWSNEYKKWVMMDPGCDPDDGRKGTRHFERHGIPMNAHDLHIAAQTQDFDGIVECTDPEPIGGTVKENVERYSQFCTTLRNNFLTSLYPEEPEHGMVPYTYDGHVWHESDSMPLPQFSLTSRRSGDFNWSVNQTHIVLQQGSEPHSITVLLDTMTPNFQSYLVQINQGDWKESEERFVWKLSPGNNSLRVKSKNQFGVEGIENHLIVERK